MFYDGPPFANGLPHYGHLLTGYAKDLFPRFQTMRGRQVHRRFGWDTHGLPAELEAMRQLGITEKHEIEDMGIDVFNAKARESVLEYTREWQDYVTRQARWVDFDNDYKTLDTTFMESVIWAFKRLHDKGLAYEGFRVLPYCWHDETPLSNHELRMDDDVYKMRQDQSVTVTFPLVGEEAEALGLTGVEALAWTTTPWTLPTNLALAVGPGIGYAVVPSADGVHDYLLATETIDAYIKELGYESGEEAWKAIKRTYTGSQLEGVQYARLWDYYADTEKWGTQNAWRILTADYVATGEGTGIVHQAPAYGEDDQAVVRGGGHPGDHLGRRWREVLPLIEDVAGLQVFEANKPLTQKLRGRRPAVPGRELRAQLPALLALPQSAHLQGRVELVRARARVPRPQWASSTSRSTGCPRTSRRGRSASGSATPATGRSPATATGVRPSRCGRATIRRIRASTCTARSPSSRRTSAAFRPTRTA